MKKDSVSINSELRKLRMEMEYSKQNLNLIKECVFVMYKLLEKKRSE